MKTVQEINEIKERTLKEIENPSDGKIRVVVGYATCGIAAGSKPVFDTFEAEVKKHGLKNVKVSQTGCLGICKLEPIVDVFVPGKERVTYVKLTADHVKAIVEKHIIGGAPVTEYVIGNE